MGQIKDSVDTGKKSIYWRSFFSLNIPLLNTYLESSSILQKLTVQYSFLLPGFPIFLSLLSFLLLSTLR